VRILIIGYGSIGRRHEEVLSTFSNVESIHIVTKQTLANKITFPTLDAVKSLDSYDYIIIASETYKHFEQLTYLESHTRKKLIFCEKPLFETEKIVHILNNTVFVGYVLRFHPLLQKMRTLLLNEKVLSANIYCGQYLPTWRQNVDYRTSYSSKKSEGGGVLLDLSHEIDYAQWLFGEMLDIKSYQLKISDLEIDSDDIVSLISKTKKGVLLSLSIDYISKITRRQMTIHTPEHTYELDLINNILMQKDKAGLEKKYEFESLERNSMFKEMHQSILCNATHACTYAEAQNVMKTIAIIQEQNR